MFECVEVVTDDVEVLGILVFLGVVVLGVWDDNRFCVGTGEVTGEGLADEIKPIPLVMEGDFVGGQCILELLHEEVSLTVKELRQHQFHSLNIKRVGIHILVIINNISVHDVSF